MQEHQKRELLEKDDASWEFGMLEWDRGQVTTHTYSLFVC